MPNSSHSHEAILAIVQEFNSIGVRPTKTFITKYVYLIDVFYAEEMSNNTTWSEIRWQFLHFGPWSPAIDEALSTLSLNGFLSFEKIESDSYDNEFNVYETPKWKVGPSLDSIQLPVAVVTKLKRLVRLFSGNLPALLNYVYFDTTPMESARPNDFLDFSGCRKIDFRTSIKPIQMNSIEHVKLEELRALLRKHVAARKSLLESQAADGPYDDIYFSAINSLEDEAEPVSVRGSVSINI